jgi:hypothetical protein
MLFDLPPVNKKSYLLSKTTFVKGKQCEKTIYLNKFKKEEKDKPSLETLRKFKKGRDFETDFKATFHGGIDLKDKHQTQIEQYAKSTKDLLMAYNQIVIFEAGLIYDEVLILVDVLRKNEDGSFDVFEVKGSKVINEAIHWDLALQYYVAKAKLGTIKSFNLVHQDTNGGFKIIDMTAVLETTIAQTQAEITHFKSILEKGIEPNIKMGNQCDKPYTCDFKTYCGG